MPSHRTTIAKQGPKSLTPRRKTSSSLAEKFGATLDAHRATLHTSLLTTLSDTVTTKLTSLSTLHTTFNTQLSLLSDQQSLALSPFANEQVQVTFLITSPDGVRSREARNFTLEERMRLFEGRVEEKTKRLRALWRDWEAVVRELVSLALAILGGEGVEVIGVGVYRERLGDHSEMPDIEEGLGKLHGAMEEGRRRYIQCQGEYENVMNRFDDFDGEVGELVASTKERVTEMQKEINLVKQRKIKALQKALEDLTGDE